MKNILANIGQMNPKERHKFIEFLETNSHKTNNTTKENKEKIHTHYIIPRDKYSIETHPHYETCFLKNNKRLKLTGLNDTNEIDFKATIISGLLMSLSIYSLNNKIGLHFAEIEKSHLIQIDFHEDLSFDAVKKNVLNQIMQTFLHTEGKDIEEQIYHFNVILSTNPIFHKEKISTLKSGFIVINCLKNKRFYEISAIFDSFVYDKKLIESLLYTFQKTLLQSERNSALHKDSIHFVSKEHQLELLKWSQAEKSYHQEKSLNGLIKSALLLHGKKIALSSHNAQKLSFEDLKSVTDEYAEKLSKIIAPKSIVVIYIENSIEFVVTVLALLFIGATYVPVDVKQPITRLKQIINNTKTKFLICDDNQFEQEIFDQLSIISKPKIDLSKNKKSSPDFTIYKSKPQDLAYIIYTSGTTGEPKGVKITHQAASGVIQELVKEYDISSKDRVLQFASVGFDVSVFEILSPLVAGASLFIMDPKEKIYPEKIESFIANNEITIADIPPVFLPLLNPKLFNSVRLLSVGSEQFLTKTVAPFNNNDRRILNSYGPTEATVMMSLYDIQQDSSINPAIGKPIKNTCAYVLNKNLKQLPIGAIGELYIGGGFLAQGYLNDIVLTKKSFISIHIQGKKQRIYKTGDYIRWRSDGNLEIFGRVDKQLKIRGYRIEPGDIETLLSKHPVINQAVITCLEDDNSNKMLVAYLVFEKATKSSINEIKSFLKDKLPDYMIPTQYFILDSIPYDKSGKIDFSKLKFMSNHDLRHDANQNIINSQSSSESELISNIIKKFTNTQTLKSDENIFHYGIDSLSAAQMVAEIKRSVNCSMSTADFYKNPTINGLLTVINSNHKNDDYIKISFEDLITHLKNICLTYNSQVNKAPVNMVYFHCAGGSAILNKKWSYKLNPKLLNFISVQLPGHDGRIDEPPLRSIEDMASHIEEELTPLFNKPVIFIGHSMGCLLAYELAIRLQKKKLSIKQLIIVASRAPNVKEQHNINLLDNNDLIKHIMSYGRFSDNNIENLERITKFMPAIYADTIAARNYHQEPKAESMLSVPIVCIYGKDDASLKKQNITPWQKYTSDTFELKIFQGGHFLMLEQEDLFIDEINQIIQSAFDKKN